MLKGILWRKGVNGCGVFGIRAPFHKVFEKDCALHDLLYDEGGNGADRLKADREMLAGMIRKAEKAWLCWVAIGYFAAIRAAGWLFFNYDNAATESRHTRK